MQSSENFRSLRQQIDLIAVAKRKYSKNWETVKGNLFVKYALKLAKFTFAFGVFYGTYKLKQSKGLLWFCNAWNSA